METNRAQPPSAIFKDPAVNDDVVQALWAALETKPADVLGWLGLRGMLEAENASDPGLLRLTATLACPEEAAQIINGWATVLVQYVNDIYRGDGEDHVFFSEQLIRAESELSAAEVALVAFQSANCVEIPNNELSAKLTTKKQNGARIGDPLRCNLPY